VYRSPFPGVGKPAMVVVRVQGPPVTKNVHSPSIMLNHRDAPLTDYSLMSIPLLQAMDRIS